MSISSKEAIENFLSDKTVSLRALAEECADVSVSTLEKEHAFFSKLCADKEQYESLLAACDIPLESGFSFAQASMTTHAGEEFCGGQMMVDVRMMPSQTNFKIPLWKKEQEKSCFLPDIFKLARQTGCRLVVLLDGDREWAADGCNPARQYLTVNDTAMDSSLESECSDKDGHCVLTWLRVYEPGERVILDESALDSAEGHDGKVFQSMTQEQTAYGGHRCAVLRVDAAAWQPGHAPPGRVWSAFEALFNRGLSECNAAYQSPPVMLVDVGDSKVDEQGNYWGYGDRVAALLALDAAISSLDAPTPTSTSATAPSSSAFPTPLLPGAHAKEQVQLQEQEQAQLLPPPPPSEGQQEQHEGTDNENEKEKEMENEKHIGEKGQPAGARETRSLSELMKEAAELLRSSPSTTASATGTLSVTRPETKADICTERDSDGQGGGHVDAKEAAALLLECAKNSNQLKQEYLSRQKELSSVKLAQRLQRRREGKQKKNSDNTDATTSSTCVDSGDDHHPEGSPTTNNTDTIHDININVPRILWQLLCLSRHLAVTLEQYVFLYHYLQRAATKLLARVTRPEENRDR